jgi:hypothetical protein
MKFKGKQDLLGQVSRLRKREWLLLRVVFCKVNKRSYIIEDI